MALTEYKTIGTERVNEIFDNIGRVKVGLIGDICIDIYWLADMTLSEISRETPHHPLIIVDERFGLGAGGNVLSNLAALKPKEIFVTGIIGDDWRGGLISRHISALNVSDKFLLKKTGFKSYAYCKPLRKGISDVVYEDPRLDFSGSPMDSETEKELVVKLEAMAAEVDIICVSDQFMDGCITPLVREKICELGKSMKIIVDSRDRIALYRNVTIKPNQVEGVAAAADISGIPAESFHSRGVDGYIEAAGIIKKDMNCDISMTLGKDGCMQFYGGKAVHVHGRIIDPPIDFCGAGDTFLSSFTVMTGAGAAPEEAGIIAGMASEVTIKKIAETGTASRDEIMNRYKTAY